MNVLAIALVAVLPIVARYLFSQKFLTEEQRKPAIPGNTGLLLSLPGIVFLFIVAFVYEDYLSGLNPLIQFGALIFLASAFLAHTFWRVNQYRFRVGIWITAAATMVISLLALILPTQKNQLGALFILSGYMLSGEIGLILCGFKMKSDEEQTRKQSVGRADRA